MHSNVTIKNVSWPHLSWPTLYSVGISTTAICQIISLCLTASCHGTFLYGLHYVPNHTMWSSIKTDAQPRWHLSASNQRSQIIEDTIGPSCLSKNITLRACTLLILSMTQSIS